VPRRADAALATATALASLLCGASTAPEALVHGLAWWQAAAAAGHAGIVAAELGRVMVRHPVVTRKAMSAELRDYAQLVREAMA
jgi:hypothetical protein